MMSRMCVRKSRRSSLERIDGFVVTPLAKPRWRAASISCKLALSTKNFTDPLLPPADDGRGRLSPTPGAGATLSPRLTEPARPDAPAPGRLPAKTDPHCHRGTRAETVAEKPGRRQRLRALAGL